MVIFIDESGTHKQIGHSSVAVVYLELSNAEKFEEGFSKVLKDLKLEEFHWADQGWEIRKRFFNRVEDLNFTFKVAIFENPAHPDKMMKKVFEQIITEDNIKSIFIDGKKPKWYEKSLKNILWQKGILVSKLRTVRNERSYFGIQMADAMAGLIRYGKDNPQEKAAESIIKKLKRKAIYVAEFYFKVE